MKKFLLFFLLFIVSESFSQSINDFKAVIIPMKYDFLKTENEYRLQTITKINLQKAGFQAFYATESFQSGITDRCSFLYVDVKKDNGFLVTKLFIVFKDCYGTIIFQSEIGKSREKSFQTAYVDALNNAFQSVYTLQYKYNGNISFSPKTEINVKPSAVTPNVPAVAIIPVETVPVKEIETKSTEITSSNKLYAQPTAYGFQLIDSEPKVVIKVYKTSNPESFIAIKGSFQGILISKDKHWLFEYYQNHKLISEKIDVKF